MEKFNQFENENREKTIGEQLLFGENSLVGKSAEILKEITRKVCGIE